MTGDPHDDSESDDSWQPRIPPEKTRVVFGGLLLVILLAALDQTIVSTALPKVIADLNGLDRYSWVATAYLLCSTVTIPLYGKLSDLFGRKRILMFGIFMFLAGSAWCGAAQSMNQLIVARGFQGIGAGALMPVVFAALGDLFSPRERGKYQGFTGGTFGVASVVGPFLGGWITDHSSWRWVFYVNLPVGIVAALVLLWLMPSLSTGKSKVKIDFVGAALLVVGLIPPLIALDWAGSGSAGLLSESVLVLFAIGIVALALFVWHELRTKEPIVDLRLFRNSIVAVSSLVTLANGVANMGTSFFIPFFVQGVLGASASTSGNIMMPMMLAMILGSSTSGQFVSRRGKYWFNALIGALVASCGLALMLLLGMNATLTQVVVAVVVMGAGFGVSNSLYSTIVQNAVPFSKMGQATSSVTMSRQLGSTIGLAFMGSFMHVQISPSGDAGGIMDQAAKVAFSAGFHSAYLCAFLLSLSVIVLVFFLKEIPLYQGPKPPTAPE